MKRTILVTLVLGSFAATAEDYLMNHVNGNASGSAGAAQERMANPLPEPWRTQVPLPKSAPKKEDPSQKAFNDIIQQFNKKFPPPSDSEPPLTEKDYQQMEQSYQQQSNTPFTPGDFSACNGKPCPFEQAAKECGEKMQVKCSPANMGGRTMCGMAVAEMLKCMKPHLQGASSGCTGSCGHGKMFVTCANGQMQQCGYEKVSNNDNRCKMPGAVLAYDGSTSTTDRGREFGHVEFVCGQGRYCSVYAQVRSRPWPSTPPHACWYPKSGGVQK
jgi:hypothetical protein